jgi:hypothetical protein
VPETGEALFGATNGLNVFAEDLEGSWTNTGLLYHLNIPGVGAVLIDAGRIIRDADGNVLFVAGNHQLILGDDVLCAALGE